MDQTKNSPVIKFSYFACSIWILAALFFLYEFYLRTLLSSLVPELLHSLQINTEQLSLIDIAYCVTYGVMQIPVGLLIDKYGVKRMLLLAICCCASGVAVFSLASGFYIAFLARLLIGLGSSFAFVSLLVITLNTLPKKIHGAFFGFSQLIGTSGALIAGAPLIMMLQLTHDNWRLLLVASSIFGFALFLLLFILFKSNPKFTAQPQRPSSTNSLEKLRFLLRCKNLYSLFIYSATIYVSITLLGTLWGTTYLETRGIKATDAGFVTSMLWLGLALGAPLLGYLSDLLQRRKPILLFCALLGIASSIAIIYTPGHSVPLFVGLFFCMGVASSGQSVAFIAVAKRTASDLKATAMGANNAVISVAIAAGIPLISFIIQHAMHSATLFERSDFSVALLLMPFFYSIALLTTLFINRRYERLR